MLPQFFHEKISLLGYVPWKVYIKSNDLNIWMSCIQACDNIRFNDLIKIDRGVGNKGLGNRE